jgi:D-alanyl-D-alanine carboxypeptidase
MSVRRKLLLALILGPLAALGIVIGIDRAFFAQTTKACVFEPRQSSRPGLQRILDGAVSSKLAPGATAFVSGPHGTWSGAAGVADASTCAPMTADARMRLESVSKIYTATLILQLAQERKLRVGDTVERWLPGLLPYGRRITIRELLTMTSGLVDNNDFTGATDAEKRASIARIRDATVRTKLYAIAARVNENPATTVSDIWWIRWAAWQPLLSPPGTLFHYSNIGYDILGRIAARAGGKPLPGLYREQIFAPLGLRATAYAPQGPIAGAHAHGYGIEPNGTRIDTTDWHWGVAAEGGIVSNARDTATFLTALMRGRLLTRRNVAAMEDENLWRGGAPSRCAGQAYGWSGGGSGYKTEVWVNDGGTRVAVLLLNGRHLDTAQAAADNASAYTMSRLYCAA